MSGKTRSNNACATTNLERCYQGSQQYSITALTNSGGNIVERYAYDAYGRPIFLNASGTEIGSSGQDNRYTYTGREWDEDAELYHYRARMYDPLSGRFCSRDPIGPEIVYSDLYEYCNSAAVSLIDWDGESPQRPNAKKLPIRTGPGCENKFLWMAPNLLDMKPDMDKVMKCFADKMATPPPKNAKIVLEQCMKKHFLGIRANGEQAAIAIARYYCCKQKEASGDKPTDPCFYGTNTNDPPQITKPRHFPCWDPSDPTTTIPDKDYCLECCKFRGCVDGFLVIFSGGKFKRESSPKIADCMTACGGGSGPTGTGRPNR